MKVCLIKIEIISDMIGQNCLYPVYNSDIKFLNRCKINKPILISHRKSRNPNHHKLIFAIAACIIDNLPDEHFWKKFSSYNLIKAIMWEEKIIDMNPNIDGTFRMEPKHINFEDMDEEEFILVSDAIFKHGSKFLNIEEYELRKNYKRYL